MRKNTAGGAEGGTPPAPTPAIGTASTPTPGQTPAPGGHFGPINPLYATRNEFLFFRNMVLTNFQKYGIN